MLPGLRERRLNEYIASAWHDAKVLEINSDDGWTTFWMHFMSKHCILKND